MVTAEWISAIAAVISIPISIWAITKSTKNAKNIKKVEQQIINNVKMRDGNVVAIGGNRK